MDRFGRDDLVFIGVPAALVQGIHDPFFDAAAILGQVS